MIIKLTVPKLNRYRAPLQQVLELTMPAAEYFHMEHQLTLQDLQLPYRILGLRSSRGFLRLLSQLEVPKVVFVWPKENVDMQFCIISFTVLL